MKKKFDKKIKLDREKVKKIMSQKFYKQLKVFEKVEPKKIPTRKPQDYAINLKKNFVLKKEKMYLMSKQEKKEVREFVEEQLRKGYIRPSKSPQTLLVFFVEKKDRKKKIVQDY